MGSYTGTVQMNFRGQDKERQNAGPLGANPNTMDVQDEYITNLQ